MNCENQNSTTSDSVRSLRKVLFKGRKEAVDGMDKLVGVSSCKLVEGLGFNSWSEHVPRL